jgi:hypothetical protein
MADVHLHDSVLVIAAAMLPHVVLPVHFSGRACKATVVAGAPLISPETLVGGCFPTPEHAHLAIAHALTGDSTREKKGTYLKFLDSFLCANQIEIVVQLTGGVGEGVPVGRARCQVEVDTRGTLAGRLAPDVVLEVGVDVEVSQWCCLTLSGLEASERHQLNALDELDLKRCASVECNHNGLFGEKLMLCGGCGNRWYCDGACQRRDWKHRHKHECSLES